MRYEASDQVFVAMPFSPAFRAAFERVIEPAIRRVSVRGRPLVARIINRATSGAPDIHVMHQEVQRAFPVIAFQRPEMPPMDARIHALTLSADALQGLVARHTLTACRACPSLATKRVTPHTLRHGAAMALLQCGVDLSVIALWLGHESTESTEVYLHADMRLKERALKHATAAGITPRRFQASDRLLAFLEAL